MRNDFYRGRDKVGAIQQLPSGPPLIAFLDHFDSSPINPANWTVVSGSANIASSMLTLVGTSNGSTCSQIAIAAGVPKVRNGMYIEYGMKLDYTTQSGHTIGITNGTLQFIFNYSWNIGSGTTLQAYDGSFHAVAGTYYNAQHVYRIEFNPVGGNFVWKLDGVQVYSCSAVDLSNTYYISNTYAYDTGRTHVIDYVKVGYL